MFGISGTKNYMALKNAFFAKIAYEMMPDDAKSQLEQAAWGYYKGGGNPDALVDQGDVNWSLATEFERFTMYSYVFIDNEIMPPVKGEQWLSPPRNPFILRINQKELNKAIGYFRDKHNLDVNMEVA